MSETLMQVKGEKITNHTLKDFISPFEAFMRSHCDHCKYYQGMCRPNDSRGLTPMSLCITLYCNQPPDVGEILRQATKEAAKTTQEIAEQTLEEP